MPCLLYTTAKMYLFRKNISDITLNSRYLGLFLDGGGY